MRAFFAALATTAFQYPRLSASACAQRLMRSCLPLAHRIFTGTHQVPHGFIAQVGHTHCRQFTGTRQARQHQRVASVGLLTRSPGRRGIDDGANTVQSMPCAARCRAMTNPQGPAS